jgi:uncharacterized protein (TIGR02145 family)
MSKVMTVLPAAVTAVLIGTAAAQQTGTFTDGRDGQKYKTVKIGKQTWMAENLNYQTESGSWCYEDRISYCKQYGRLYDWKTAKTVCPKGWKLPSHKDWVYLGQAVGGEKESDDDGRIYWYGAGKKLKSKSGWNNRNDESSGNGTDSYGFSALSSGYRNSDGDFYGVGDFGFWWTATGSNSDFAYLRRIYYFDDHVFEVNFFKSYGLSVRCVADSP